MLEASTVVLATGGSGQLYAITTNPRESRGEGIAMAARAGAMIADPEFVQFHPTAIDIGRDPAPLATEALRGEGAVLINAKGERFMRAVHPDAELGPRDIVARGVYREVMSGRGAFLDCRKLGPSLAAHFPALVAACRSAGIDPAREPIPIAPAAHYHMGGVLTDANGRTTIRGPVGLRRGGLDGRAWREPACLQFAARGRGVRRPRGPRHRGNGAARGAACSSMPCRQSTSRRKRRSPNSLPIQMLRRTMTAKVGVIRDAASLAGALGTIASLAESGGSDRRLANMLTTAKLIATAAWMRKESRGAHFRSDYPQADPNLARRSMLTLAEAEVEAAEAIASRDRQNRSPARLHA